MSRNQKTLFGSSFVLKPTETLRSYLARISIFHRNIIFAKKKIVSNVAAQMAAGFLSGSFFYVHRLLSYVR
jgi:hypothetical protein